jgi:D-serine deaminase-like pyridoxal phosphate-dependent protein
VVCGGCFVLRKWDLETPAVVLDFDVLMGNIRFMSDYLRGKPVKLRPHVKCHKMPVIAHMQVNAGAKGLTVAKLGEAEVMVNAGIRDVFIANQVVQKSKLERLVNLNRYGTVSVAVDNFEVVETLSKIAYEKGVEVKVIEEINVGLNRCGVEPGKPAVELAEKISKSKGLIFEGVLGFEGYAIWIKEFKEREKACKECYRKLIETVKEIEKAGINVNTVGAGGTGSFNIAAEYPGINEIQPGHYAIMSASHLMIEGIPFKPALTILTTIISKPTETRAVIDGGVKTFSLMLGNPIVKDIEGVTVSALHVEHGILKLSSNCSRNLSVGDKIEFIPAYSETAINLFDKVYVVKGDEVIATWKVEARGRVD